LARVPTQKRKEEHTAKGAQAWARPTLVSFQ
jgi:hypothetical protein